MGALREDVETGATYIAEGGNAPLDPRPDVQRGRYDFK